MKLMGHVLRAEQKDPLRQVTFQANDADNTQSTTTSNTTHTFKQQFQQEINNINTKYLDETFRKERKREISSWLDKGTTTLHEIIHLDETLRIMFWNVQGMAHIAAREQIVYMMQQENIDILIMSETHINNNSTETHDDYTFVF